MGTFALLCGICLLAGAAGADTIYLKNGVKLDGTVTPQGDGDIVKVDAGGHTMLYRKNEIRTIEKNDRTGHWNREEAMARWANKDKELTELTGLDAGQRRTVDALLNEIKGAAGPKKEVLYERAKALQEQMDVFRYLEYLQPRFSHTFSTGLLELMYFLDAKRARAILRDNVFNPYFAARAKGIELLGRLHDAGSADLIMRGLADHKPEVQYMAAYALANIGARNLTPALIECLTNNDLRVAAASAEALAALWAPELEDKEKPASPEAWKAFWTENAAKAGGSPIALAGIEPPIPPEQEYQNE